jgi:hypothetical protein
LRFAGEPSELFRVVGERLGQNLQRDIAIELCVSGPKHLPHPAHADLRGNFVHAEAGTGINDQVVRIIRGGRVRAWVVLVHAVAETNPSGLARGSP